MNKARVCMTLGLCVVAVAAQANAQRKAGLWEVTATMSMSGMPNMPAMGSHTQDICVTQAMIDKYGGPYNNPQNGQCQTSDVVLTATGMTAKVTCTGRMSMSGTVQTTFVDANTTKTTIQMTMAMPNGQSMTTTTQMTAVYKGPDCGSVKPTQMPASQ